MSDFNVSCKQTDVFFPSVSDINELNLPKTCEINFPDDDDLLNFRLIISPDEVRRSLAVRETVSLQDCGSEESRAK